LLLRWYNMNECCLVGTRKTLARASSNCGWNLSPFEMSAIAFCGETFSGHSGADGIVVSGHSRASIRQTPVLGASREVVS
jgi:hypothetical protein